MRSLTPSGELEQHVLLYDLDCGFCRWTTARVLAWDRGGRLRPAPIQSAIGDWLLAGVDPRTKLDSWHLVTPGGIVYSAGAVVAPLARLLPGGRPVAAIAARWPLATERVYRFGASRRARISRLVPAAAKLRADERIERSELATG